MHGPLAYCLSHEWHMMKGCCSFTSCCPPSSSANLPLQFVTEYRFYINLCLLLWPKYLIFCVCLFLPTPLFQVFQEIYTCLVARWTVTAHSLLDVVFLTALLTSCSNFSPKYSFYINLSFTVTKIYNDFCFISSNSSFVIIRYSRTFTLVWFCFYAKPSQVYTEDMHVS